MDSHTPTQERNQVLGKFVNSLRVSGYGQPIRQDILEGILLRDRQLRESGGPRYRTREEIEQHKAGRDDCFINTWFLRGTTTSVLEVQPTPGGVLASKVRDKLKGVVAPDGGTTLVVEGAGKSILAGLRQADPFLKNGCRFGGDTGPDNCLIDTKQNCWQSRIVYMPCSALSVQQPMWESLVSQPTGGAWTTCKP